MCTVKLTSSRELFAIMALFFFLDNAALLPTLKVEIIDGD